MSNNTANAQALEEEKRKVAAMSTSNSVGAGNGNQTKTNDNAQIAKKGDEKDKSPGFLSRIGSFFSGLWNSVCSCVSAPLSWVGLAKDFHNSHTNAAKENFSQVFGNSHTGNFIKNNVLEITLGPGHDISNASQSYQNAQLNWRVGDYGAATTEMIMAGYHSLKAIPGMGDAASIPEKVVNGTIAVGCDLYEAFTGSDSEEHAKSAVDGNNELSAVNSPRTPGVKAPTTPIHENPNHLNNIGKEYA